jgi:hypothetical protein
MIMLRARNLMPAIRDLGPYLLVELLLPGGTLIALLLWLTRRYLSHGFGNVREKRSLNPGRCMGSAASPQPSRMQRTLSGAYAKWFRLKAAVAL